MHNIIYSTPFLAIKGRAMPAGKPTRGRPPKQKGNRGRITLRLPVDTIADIKWVARREKKSQADVIVDAVHLILIAQGFIKEKVK